MSRPCRALIDLDALCHNYQLATELAPQSQAIAVVKANAYGHGAVPVAKALAPLAPAFGVACIEEAMELRSAGIEKPILLLEGIFTADELATAAAQNFWLMVENLNQVEAIINAELSAPLHCWVKVDSGMHRLGLQPEQLDDVLAVLNNSANVHGDIVIASHFASADELTRETTAAQIDCFDRAVAAAPLAQGLAQSLSNSAAILAHPKAHRQWLRPGIMLYGGADFDCAHKNLAKQKPVMSLVSKVISLRSLSAGERVGYGGRWQAQRDSIIATIACGYGDGYPRHAVDGTPVLVNGVEAPLAGKVSMDMITVDVTDVAGVKIGSEVELWGNTISINRVAAAAGTISYELITRMPARPTRIYRAAEN
ncbi:MAG: alanine racemase [Cellvibrionaceae bacterium]|nr:alanine racemase [Cellvibrionaceae bacterium]